MDVLFLIMSFAIMMPNQYISSNQVPPARPLMGNVIDPIMLLNQNTQIVMLNQNLLRRNQQLESLLRQYMYLIQSLSLQIETLKSEKEKLTQFALECDRIVALARPLYQHPEQNAMIPAISINQTRSTNHQGADALKNRLYNRRPIDPALRKTKPCRNFNTSKGCRFGDDCAFQHNS